MLVLGCGTHRETVGVQHLSVGTYPSDKNITIGAVTSVAIKAYQEFIAI